MIGYRDGDEKVVCTFCQDPDIQIVISWGEDVIAGCDLHYETVRELSERRHQAAEELP